MIINVSEAKTNPSKLIDMAYHGEEVIIAKNNLPLVAAHIPLNRGFRRWNDRPSAQSAGLFP